MATLDSIRASRPWAADMGDAELLQVMADHAKAPLQNVADAFGVKTGQDSGVLMSGLSSGTDALQGLGYSAMGAVADAFGAKDAKKWALRNAGRNQAEAALNGRPELEQVENQTLGSALDFAGYQIAKQVPQIGGMMALGAVAPAAAVPTWLARGAATLPAAVGGGGLRAGASYAARKAALETGDTFARNLVGGAGVGSVMGAGSMYQESVDAGDPSPYAALGLAPLYGVTEGIPQAVLGGTLMKTAFNGNLLARMGKAAGVNAVGGATSEVVQNEMEMGFNPNLTPEEKFSRRLNSGVIGGLAEGTIGSVGGLRGKTPPLQDNEPRDLLRSVEDIGAMSQLMGIGAEASGPNSLLSAGRTGQAWQERDAQEYGETRNLAAHRLGAQWQQMGVEPTGEYRSTSLGEIGAQNPANDGIGTLGLQRDQEGAQGAQMRSQQLADIGQQAQDLDIRSTEGLIPENMRELSSPVGGRPAVNPAVEAAAAKQEQQAQVESDKQAQEDARQDALRSMFGKYGEPVAALIPGGSQEVHNWMGTPYYTPVQTRAAVDKQAAAESKRLDEYGAAPQLADQAENMYAAAFRAQQTARAARINDPTDPKAQAQAVTPKLFKHRDFVKLVEGAQNAEQIAARVAMEISAETSKGETAVKGDRVALLQSFHEALTGAPVALAKADTPAPTTKEPSTVAPVSTPKQPAAPVQQAQAATETVAPDPIDPEVLTTRAAARSPVKRGTVTIGREVTTLMWKGVTKSVPTQAFRRLQRVVGMDDAGDMSLPPMTYEDAGRMEDAEREAAGKAHLKGAKQSVQKSIKSHFGLGKDVVEAVNSPDVAGLNRGVVASEVDPDAVSNVATDETGAVESRPVVSDELMEDQSLDAGDGLFDNKRDHAIEGKESGFQVGASLQKVNTGLIGANDHYIGPKSGPLAVVLRDGPTAKALEAEGLPLAATIHSVAMATRATKVGGHHRFLTKRYAGTPEAKHPELARIIADTQNHEKAVLEKRASRLASVFQASEVAALEARNAAIIARNEQMPAEHGAESGDTTVDPLEADTRDDWNKNLDDGDVEWKLLTPDLKDEATTLYSLYNDGTLKTHQYYGHLQTLSDKARKLDNLRNSNAGTAASPARAVSDTGGGRDTGPGGDRGESRAEGRDANPVQNGEKAPANARTDTTVVTKSKPKVVRDAQGRRINQDVIGPDTSAAAAINRDVTGPGIPNVAINSDAAQFSKGTQGKGSKASELESDLKKFMRTGAFGNKVTVVQSMADLPAGIQRSVNPTADTQGFVVNNKAYLIADNIAPGRKARAVLLHEVGAHLGLENLLGATQYAALVNKVKQWAALSDGSQESKIARAAQQRVADAGTDATQTDSELVAYFIEEAVDAGIDPTATKADTEFGRWFRTLWAAFKTAMHRLGVNPDKLTAQDVVDMAYGAAKLEVTGTFHGTAGNFRKFDHKYMGSGEGAQAFGWGSYFAQAPGIAKGYWKTDVRNKTPNDKTLHFEGKAYTLDQLRTEHRAAADANRFEDSTKFKVLRAIYRNGVEQARNDNRSAIGVNPNFLGHQNEKAWLAEHGDKVSVAKPEGPEGALMRVDFNVADDEWLDLDKPLSEQSEKVQQALAESQVYRALRYKKNKFSWPYTGKDYYETLAKKLDPKGASEWLDATGVKGNRFMDANSRRGPTPLEITDAYEDVARYEGLLVEQDALIASGKDRSPTGTIVVKPTLRAAWEQRLSDARDNLAKLEEATSKRTSNFVVFNDKNIQRVSSMKAADRNRVSFSKASIIPQSINDSASDFLEVLKSKGSNALVKMMLTSDLIANANTVLKGIPLKYKAAMDAITVEKTKAELRVADIVKSFAKLPKHEQGKGDASVNKVLKDATMAKAWPFVPDWLPKGSVEVDPNAALTKRFNGLSADGQAMVKRVFQHGHDSLKALQAAVTDNTNSEYDALIKELTKAGKMDEAKAESAKKARSLQDFESLMAIRSGWPYAPLRRFGKHVVMAMSARYKLAKDSGDVKTIRELEKNGDHYYVAFAEGKGEAQRMVRELKADYPDGDVGTFEKLDKADGMMGGRDMLGAMRRLRRMAKESVEDKGLGEKTGARVDDMMRQLYLTLLSETSARKGEIHRKNIAGANEDMMRAFSTQGAATAHFIASLKTNGKIEDHLADMRTEVSSSLSDRDEKQRYFNEIMARHSVNLEFNPTPGIDKALSISSVYLLLSNPSYFLMNATQPWMMSQPMMAGRHGYARSAAALVQGYRDVMPILKDAQFDEKSYAKLPTDVRAAIEALANKGVIQIELGQELGDFKSSPDDRMRHLALALGKLRGAAQGVETLNRLSTAIAAYRLEKQRTGSPEAGVDYAAQVINETHGDYTGFNAPRFMRSGLGRLTTQFRKFQLIQLSMFARLIHRSFKGATPEEKIAARYALGYNLAHLTAIGGAAALPGFTAAAWLVGKAIPGDDEPDDPRATLTRAVGKEMADLLWGGASQAAGVPLGGRVGAGNMLSLLPYTDIEVSRKGYADILLGMTGPLIGGLMPRAYDGIGMVASGDLWKGAEALAPSGVANISKAVRFQVDGVTQRNGDQALSPDDISYLDMALQAVGLPTNTIQERTYLAGAKFKADTFYKDRTTSLKQDYSRAFRDNDADAMREVREDWQSTQVTRRELGLTVQPLSDLLKAPQEQRKREAGMVGGVGSNKSTEGFLRAMSGE